MRMRLVLFGIFLLNPFLAGDLWAGSSAISRQLEKVSRELVKDYEAKNPGKADVGLAAFSFNSSKELARRNVGLAVSELLLPYFVKSPTFGVVERSALTKVLQEWKLQVTGAVDSDTAVRVGRLIGAEVLLLGSVDKLGGRYHVNARLVDAESGKVVAVAYEELAAGLFEEEAKSFLALAPKRQMIGFYFLYNIRHNSNNLAANTFPDFFSNPVTVTPDSFSLSLAGLGVRYFPRQALAVDFSGAIVINSPVVAKHPASAPIGGTTVSMPGGFFMRGTASWVRDFRFRSRTYLGGGLSFYKLGTGTSKLVAYTYVTPLLRAGYEFKIQERLGASFFINYDLLSGTGKGTDLIGHTEVIRLGKFSFEPQVALYF